MLTREIKFGDTVIPKVDVPFVTETRKVNKAGEEYYVRGCDVGHYNEKRDKYTIKVTKLNCHCGTGRITPHEIGRDGCVRRIVKAPIPAGTHKELGCKMWDTGHGIVTDYTLVHQRGYYQHEDGTWSDWNGSTNSLPDET